MKILIRLTSNYGTPVAYPLCDNARAFAAIAGTKTLTRAALERIRALGFRVEIERRSADELLEELQ